MSDGEAAAESSMPAEEAAKVKEEYKTFVEEQRRKAKEELAAELMREGGLEGGMPPDEPRRKRKKKRRVRKVKKVKRVKRRRKKSSETEAESARLPDLSALPPLRMKGTKLVRDEGDSAVDAAEGSSASPAAPPATTSPAEARAGGEAGVAGDAPPTAPSAPAVSAGDVALPAAAAAAGKDGSGGGSSTEAVPPLPARKPLLDSAASSGTAGSSRLKPLATRPPPLDLAKPSRKEAAAAAAAAAVGSDDDDFDDDDEEDEDEEDDDGDDDDDDGSGDIDYVVTPTTAVVYSPSPSLDGMRRRGPRAAISPFALPGSKQPPLPTMLASSSAPSAAAGAGAGAGAGSGRRALPPLRRRGDSMSDSAASGERGSGEDEKTDGEEMAYGDDVAAAAAAAVAAVDGESSRASTPPHDVEVRSSMHWEPPSAASWKPAVGSPVRTAEEIAKRRAVMTYVSSPIGGGGGRGGESGGDGAADSPVVRSIAAPAFESPPPAEAKSLEELAWESSCELLRAASSDVQLQTAMDDMRAKLQTWPSLHDIISADDVLELVRAKLGEGLHLDDYGWSSDAVKDAYVLLMKEVNRVPSPRLTSRASSSHSLSPRLASRASSHHRSPRLPSISSSKLDDAVSARKEEKDDEPLVWPQPLREEETAPLSSDYDELYMAVTTLQRLRVWTVTWNLHAKPPPADLSAMLPPDRHHIYAIGSEECEQTIAKSIIKTAKPKWEAALKRSLGSNYVMLCSHTLQAIHLVVFVHRALLPLVSTVQSAAVATGIGKRLGNKGGVGIGFFVGGSSLLFINCHLAAHQKNVKQRNADYNRIISCMQLPVLPSTSSSLPGNVIDRYDRVFYMGDLNYRINTTRRMAEACLKRNMRDVLYNNDQLRLQMAAGMFAGLREGPLLFRPTYKFDTGCDVYDSSAKQRIPSWTDRILYRCTTCEDEDDACDCLRLCAYDSIPSIRTSDHRPVIAAFDVAVDADEATALPPAARGAVGQQTSEVCVIS
eukprot:PLAT3336.13.p1 GENE.PLAT3336.13~~PLAT3336.13.p1  ORF type:complete len:996 (-),score=419.40 PLAT3336.13:68-3055(-)